MEQNYSEEIDNSEFKDFADFFIQYLYGSATFDEAFARAAFTYRKLFKNVPYPNCQAFLSDFYKSNYQGHTA